MAALPPIIHPDTQLPLYEIIERKIDLETTSMSMDLDVGFTDVKSVHTPSAFSKDDIEVAKALTGLKECKLNTPSRIMYN